MELAFLAPQLLAVRVIMTCLGQCMNEVLT